MQQFADHAPSFAPPSLLEGKLCDKVFTGEARAVPKGTRIFRPGDAAVCLYRIVSGSVALSSPAPDGGDVTLRLYGAGDVFGELCFSEDVRKHYATALEPTTYVTGSADGVLAALHDRPDLALGLIGLLTDRLARAYGELQTLSGEPLAVRLARKLFDLSAVDEDAGWRRLPRHFTHDELARMLGVRRESLTRAMIDLRALGLIDYAPHVPVRVAVTPLRRFISPTQSTT